MKQGHATLVLLAGLTAGMFQIGCASHSQSTTQPVANNADIEREKLAEANAEAYSRSTDEFIEPAPSRPALSAVGNLWTYLIDDVLQKKPAYWARQMQDPNFPDERRLGMMNLVKREWAQKPPFTDRYRQLAVMDDDYTVRSAALRALNISRDRQAVPVFIESLTSPEKAVRIEAVKGLNNVPDASAVPHLIKLTRDTDRDVRIAAVEALRQYKTADVARLLVSLLQDRDFGVAWQARQSLMRITGADFKYNDKQWSTHISSTPGLFS